MPHNIQTRTTTNVSALTARFESKIAAAENTGTHDGLQVAVMPPRSPSMATSMDTAPKSIVAPKPESQPVDAPKPAAYVQFLRTNTAAREFAEAGHALRHNVPLDGLLMTGKAFDKAFMHSFEMAYDRAIKNGDKESDALKSACKTAKNYATGYFSKAKAQTRSDYANFMAQQELVFGESLSQNMGHTHINVYYQFQPSQKPAHTIADDAKPTALNEMPPVPTSPLPAEDISVSAPKSKKFSAAVTKHIQLQRERQRKERKDQTQENLASLRTQTELPMPDMPVASPETATYRQFQEAHTKARQAAEAGYRTNNNNIISHQEFGYEFEQASMPAFKTTYTEAIASGLDESAALKLACKESKEFAIKVFNASEEPEYMAYANFMEQREPVFFETASQDIGIRYAPLARHDSPSLVAARPESTAKSTEEIFPQVNVSHGVARRTAWQIDSASKRRINLSRTKVRGQKTEVERTFVQVAPKVKSNPTKPESHDRKIWGSKKLGRIANLFKKSSAVLSVQSTTPTQLTKGVRTASVTHEPK